MLYKQIDSLNLIYVALTRARSAMYIYSAPGNGHDIYKWADAVLSEMPCSEEDDVIKEYTFGELTYANVEENDAESQSCSCGYPSVDYSGEMSKVELRFQTEVWILSFCQELSVYFDIFRKNLFTRTAPLNIPRQNEPPPPHRKPP